MTAVICTIIGLAVGGYLGARYGRATEQKVVTAALQDLAAVDAAAKGVVAKLGARLGYLKKAF